MGKLSLISIVKAGHRRIFSETNADTVPESSFFGGGLSFEKNIFFYKSLFSNMLSKQKQLNSLGSDHLWYTAMT